MPLLCFGTLLMLSGLFCFYLSTFGSKDILVAKKSINYVGVKQELHWCQIRLKMAYLLADKPARNLSSGLKAKVR